MLDGPGYNGGMKFLKIAGCLLLGLLVFAGVGVYFMASSLEPGVEVGSASPDVTLTDMDGKPLPLASLRGKVVLLDFWSST